jgi:signal transduction histidine kinase
LYRLRKQKAQLEKQLAVQYERQRISTEMHDDIGAGLSGVRLLTEITKNKLKNTEVTGDMDKIYESVGDISAKMKEVIWSLNTENDTIGNLVFFIQKQVRSQLEHYPGEISFDIPTTFPDIQINGEVRRNVYLAVKEAVHNIVKHSGADKIKISVIASDELIITVSDNGKGMDIEKNKSTGNGMKNMRMRMQKINGEFFIKNGEGTILTFKIPLKSGL